MQLQSIKLNLLEGIKKRETDQPHTTLMEGGEAQQQHPPLSFITATNPHHLTCNYPPDSLLSPAPPPPPAGQSTGHHYNLPPLDQEEPLPLDIDWASLLSGCTADTEPSVSSSSVAGIGGAAGASGQVGVGCQKGGGCGGGKGRNKAAGGNQRVAFHTRSVDDVLDDGYKWRKYGQKAVKDSNHPRSYYRCTYHTCTVKKQVQRLSKDTSIVVTTYEGVHNHPSEKLMETLAPLLKQLQFLAKF